MISIYKFTTKTEKDKFVALSAFYRHLGLQGYVHLGNQGPYIVYENEIGHSFLVDGSAGYVLADGKNSLIVDDFNRNCGLDISSDRVILMYVRCQCGRR